MMMVHSLMTPCKCHISNPNPHKAETLSWEKCLGHKSSATSQLASSSWYEQESQWTYMATMRTDEQSMSIARCPLLAVRTVTIPTYMEWVYNFYYMVWINICSWCWAGNAYSREQRPKKRFMDVLRESICRKLVWEKTIRRTDKDEGWFDVATPLKVLQTWTL